MTASELRRLGPTSKAFLATDHEPMRMEVRKVLGERLGFPESHLTVFQKQAFAECFGSRAIFRPPAPRQCTVLLWTFGC